ncbi:MAG: hypothetical protein ACRD96_08075, partial [Bryobacteraceae bacterium]
MAVIAAILRAQWISIRNLRLGPARRGAIFSVLTSLVWYGFWSALAYSAFDFTSRAGNRRAIETTFPRGLMFVLGYWQLTPILIASLGASLDLKKLLVYPVPPEKLFWVEVILRLTTGLEMLLLVVGSTVGLVVNPEFGGWLRSPSLLLPIGVFIFFNLLLAAGLRNLIERLLNHPRLRELIVLLMVMAAALPQALMLGGVPLSIFSKFLEEPPYPFWPWAAAGRLALAGPGPLDWALLLAWVGGVYFFSRWQFERSLRFDAQAAQATVASAPARPGEESWSDRWFRLPGVVLPDPVAAMVEKELRTLTRSPRFRLVFIMGFTFGLVVWLPMIFSPAGERSPMVENFLTLICIYALTL